MNNNGYAETSSVNIAGHSLGAHIAGIAGKLVDGRVQTIFGLDPAGLLFSINSPLERFHEDDALYTEGIRTNAGNLGFDVPLAHCDFYPNWGSRFVPIVMNLNNLNEQSKYPTANQGVDSILLVGHNLLT